MPKAQSVQEAVQDPGEVKRVLKLASEAAVEAGGIRVPIVVALDNENEALVMVARRGKGRELRAEAIKAIKKEGVGDKIDAQPSKLCFGYAFTSTATPGALMISVNKKPPGEAKLIKAIYKRVRTAGFTDVLLTADDNLENESEQDTETAGAIPPPPPPPAAPAVDAGSLSKRLATLITRVGAVGKNDQDYRSKLLGLAHTANTAIKAADLPAASTALDALEAALNEPPATADLPAESSGDKASFVKMQKSRLVWQSVRSKVASEVDQFKKVVSTQFAGDPDEDEITDALDDLDDILIALDERLINALDDLLENNLDSGERERLVAEARRILDDYATFASSDTLLAKLNGDTPFGMKFTAASTVDSALKALRQTIG